jgi:exosome complex RNA-binding protein Csl4
MGSVEQIVIPGMRICAAEDQYVSGVGTYSLHGYFYSSLAGKLKLVPKTVESDNQKGNSKPEQSKSITATFQDVISIEVHAPGQDHTVVPSVGDIVTCKVVSVNPRFAKLLIECVNDTPLKDSFRCQLRKEDVRAHDKDKLEMYKCFRPSDIVLSK